MQPVPGDQLPDRESAHRPPPLQWRKSRRSNPSGNCVEVAELPAGAGIAMRNSRDPDGPVLHYTTAEMTAFLLGVKDGDFDHLIQRSQDVTPHR